MLNRRLAALAFVAATALPPFAVARDGVKFTDAAFQSAQAAGKPILVEVSAPWCPTCKAQAPIINSLLGKPEYKDVVRLNVDFDSMKDTLKAFNVQRQSTLIVF
ncbi:MAG: thioredoxin family protein [Beijerinckiaceae bacterium]